VPYRFAFCRQLLDRLEDADTGEVLHRTNEVWDSANYVKTRRRSAKECWRRHLRTNFHLTVRNSMGDSAEDRILSPTWFPTLSAVGMGEFRSPRLPQRAASLYHGRYSPFDFRHRRTPSAAGNARRGGTHL